MMIKNIVLFGAPGVGKGTQAENLKRIHNLDSISTGDLFRFHIKNKTPLGILSKSYIDNGSLVPDSVTIAMLKVEVAKNKKSKGFIFDGFPRTKSQALALDKFLKENGTQINAMIALEVAEDILVKRLLARGKISHRSDDQDEMKIRNRFKEYNEKTAVVKDFYQAQHKYFGVNGVGEVAEITKILSQIIQHI